MDEQNCVNESDKVGVNSNSPEYEVVPVTKRPVHRGNTFGALERIARQTEFIRAFNRPLGISQELSEKMRAFNRPLGISQELSEKMRAFNRPLGISQELSEKVRAFNRPLGISQELSEKVRAFNRPLRISQELSEKVRAFNRPLGISQELSETLNAMCRPTVAPWSAGGIFSLNRRPIPAMARIPGLVESEEELDAWPESLLVKDDGYPLLEESSFWLTQFDSLVREVGLRRVCRSLFADGYYELAVQRACTYLHNVVREKSGRYDKDGADLMMAVFSPKAPTIMLNQLTTPSEKNEQQGYMFILAGTMTGIRNPRSHEHDFIDTPEEAFEILVLVNHLMRRLNNSVVAFA